LDFLKSNKPAVLTFFSARTATHFCHLLKKNGIDACPNIIVVCISQTVLDATDPIHWKERVCAKQPDAQKMLEETERALFKLQPKPVATPLPTHEGSLPPPSRSFFRM